MTKKKIDIQGKVLEETKKLQDEGKALEEKEAPGDEAKKPASKYIKGLKLVDEEKGLSAVNVKSKGVLFISKTGAVSFIDGIRISTNERETIFK